MDSQNPYTMYAQSDELKQLSKEYGQLMQRQAEIAKELDEKFPLPKGYKWGPSAYVTDPIQVWLCSNDEEHENG
jgi:hypothetical protein